MVVVSPSPYWTLALVCAVGHGTYRHVGPPPSGHTLPPQTSLLPSQTLELLLCSTPPLVNPK